MLIHHRTTSRSVLCLGFILLFAIFTVACSTQTVRSEFPLQGESKNQLQETNTSSNNVVNNIDVNEADPMIQPGFLFEMTNMEDKKLNGKFRVNFDGQLILPYQVNVQTSGLRSSEVISRLISAYKKFFQTSSAFSVHLVRRDLAVEIRGLVEKPGKYIVTPGESLESMISRAGGLKRERENKELEPRFLRITKNNNTEMTVVLRDYFKTGLLPQGVQISGGDVLVLQVDAPNGQSVVAGSSSIQVMGEVLRAGDLSFKPGADIYYYLHLAGGTAPGANMNEIRIVRGSENNRVIASLDSMEEGAKPLLQPGDIIIVPHDKPTKFERNVSTGAGFATIISAIVLLIIAL